MVCGTERIVALESVTWSRIKQDETYIYNEKKT
jgi:hypothetical protein